MIQPQLVLCRGGGVPSMSKLGGSYQDDGQNYTVLARTRPFFPAGQGGECIFTNLYLTLTGYDTAVGFGVKVYIDGVAIGIGVEGNTVGYQKVAFAGGAANPVHKHRVHELSLLQPYPPYPAPEQFRVAPRGQSIAVELATIAGAAADRIVIDGIEVEYEVVRESKATNTATNVA